MDEWIANLHPESRTVGLLVGRGAGKWLHPPIPQKMASQCWATDEDLAVPGRLQAACGRAFAGEPLN